MPKISLTTRFLKARKKLTKGNSALEVRMEKTLLIFIKNPQHPSLHLEKLIGTNIWTIRIDRGNRLFFVWSVNLDTAIFFHVGHHDDYRMMK